MVRNEQMKGNKQSLKLWSFVQKNLFPCGLRHFVPFVTFHILVEQHTNITKRTNQCIGFRSAISSPNIKSIERSRKNKKGKNKKKLILFILNNRSTKHKIAWWQSILSFQFLKFFFFFYYISSSEIISFLVFPSFFFLFFFVVSCIIQYSSSLLFLSHCVCLAINRWRMLRFSLLFFHISFCYHLWLVTLDTVEQRQTNVISSPSVNKSFIYTKGTNRGIFISRGYVFFFFLCSVWRFLLFCMFYLCCRVSFPFTQHAIII